MKWRVWLSWPLMLTLACASKSPPRPSCNPPSSNRLPVLYHRQGGDNWCWAASGQMIMEFLHTSVSQCDQANGFLRNTPCCDNDGKGLHCDHPGWPRFGRYGFDYKTTSTALTWEQLKHEIYCEQRPVATAREFLDGSSHMVVIVGYDENYGKRDLFIADPDDMSPPLWQYTEYAGTDIYRHLRDYYEIKRKAHR